MTFNYQIYTQGDILVACNWAKEEGYEVIVYKSLGNELASLEWRKTYATLKEAKRSYRRMVRKVKKGDFN